MLDTMTPGRGEGDTMQEEEELLHDNQSINHLKMTNTKINYSMAHYKQYLVFISKLFYYLILNVQLNVKLTEISSLAVIKEIMKTALMQVKFWVYDPFNFIWIWMQIFNFR